MTLMELQAMMTKASLEFSHLEEYSRFLDGWVLPTAVVQNVRGTHVYEQFHSALYFPQNYKYPRLFVMCTADTMEGPLHGAGAFRNH